MILDSFKILLIYFHGWNFHLNANSFYIYISSLDPFSKLHTCMLIQLPTQNFYISASYTFEMYYVLDWIYVLLPQTWLLLVFPDSINAAKSAQFLMPGAWGPSGHIFQII